MNRLRGASRPAQRITPQTASPVRYWLTPSHTTIVRSSRIEAGIAQTLFEIIDLEIDGDKGHPVQIGSGSLQSLPFHLCRCRVIHFKNPDGIERGEPPGPRIEARTEQHDLLGLSDRFPDPVVDQPRAGDAGGSRARPLPVDVAGQHFAHRAYRKQFG